MKSKNLLSVATVCFVLMFSITGYSQSSGYVKQVITANSGKFEYVPPYTDFVTLETFNPQNNHFNTFSTIFTQSAQSILISGQVAFITAQDSIAKYNLNTLQRISVIADSGLNRMALYNGKLLVSKQYPVSQNFLEVLDTANLSLVTRIPGISGDCGGICSMNDTVYVAVNGGWMGTEGKLAIIDPGTWTLKTEVNFGHMAIGIWDLYPYKGRIFSVNKTPYGVIDTGSVTIYTPLNRSFSNIFIPCSIAAGTGIKDSLLYLGINYGIGSFNLNTLAIADTIIIPDPGSSVFTYIISSALDSLDGRIYTNIGDYTNPGYCLVTSQHGDSITSYSTGISSDAIALDYRTYPQGVRDNSGKEVLVRLFPNPVYDLLNVDLSVEVALNRIVIIDISGRELISFRPETSQANSYQISVHSLPSGMFYVILESSEGRIVKPFVITGR
jgi:hypothetical protein